MLLDVIIWLPTLFTYVLFLLILVILFFIVAYVSHKIYISIYDNLPLPAAPGRSSRSTTVRSEPFVNQLSARSIWIPNRSTVFESSAVRITISLEPCYLANLELDIQHRTKERPVSFMCNCQLEGVTSCAAAEPRVPGAAQRINKYYTHLSNIPRLKILLKCHERSNMRLVLDDVIQDVMESRCTDSGAICRRPKPNSRVPIDLLEPSCSSHCTGIDSTRYVSRGKEPDSCRDEGSGKARDAQNEVCCSGARSSKVGVRGSTRGSGKDLHRGSSKDHPRGSGKDHPRGSGSGKKDRGSTKADVASGRQDAASGRDDKDSNREAESEREHQREQ